MTRPKGKTKLGEANLGYLGDPFQMALVKLLFEDQGFFVNLEPILDQNMFTNTVLRAIVGKMKDLYGKYETAPTYGNVIIAFNSSRNKTSNEECKAMVEHLRDNQTDITPEYTKDCAEKFFKQQNLTKAILQSEDIIKEGDANRYYEIEEKIQKALEDNTQMDYGFKIFDNMMDALNEEYRTPIPTGAEQLDDMLNGGLAKGELGVIIAPSGCGKTSATCGFAAKAAITKTKDNNFKGYKVLHIFFEDREVDIKRKYYGWLTNIEASYLSLPQYKGEAIRILNENCKEEKEMIQENVWAKRLVSGEVTASQIKVFIKQCIARGFKPDLVIIDYFECLRLERGNTMGDQEYTLEGITMRKLESITNEFNLAMWVPIQGTKDSLDTDRVTMSMGGGSVKKVQIGHVIISFARTDEMKKENRINIALHKFRGGAINNRSYISNATLNNGTCHFGIADDDDFDRSFDDDVANTARSVKKRN